MRKKILAVLLAALVMLSMAVVTASAAGPSDYVDVPDGYWAKPAIDRWSGYGIVNGMGEGQFQPKGNMKRAEFAAVMVRLLGLTEMPKSNPFTDLKEGNWQYEYVLKAYAAGIIKGVTVTTVDPDAPIQRQQAFVMMGRALGVTPKEDVTERDFAQFADGSQVQNYAKGYVAALVESGFVGGSDGKLTPKSNISRAEVVALLHKTVTTYVNTPDTEAINSVNENGRSGFIVINTSGNVTVEGDSAGVVVASGTSGAALVLQNTKVTGNVKVDAGNTGVTIHNSLISGSVKLSEDADNTTVTVPAGSTVETVETAADNVTITGAGQVGSVAVVNGRGVEISTSGTEVKVSENVGTVTAGGVSVVPGTTSTTAGTGSGFVEEGSI